MCLFKFIGNSYEFKTLREDAHTRADKYVANATFLWCESLQENSLFYYRRPEMRIEQQNSILEMLQQNSNVEGKGSNILFTEKSMAVKSKYSDKQSVFIKDSTYLNPALAERNTLTEELENQTALDATDRKNQMAVLSHTTSEEDYAKMQESGFSLDETVGNTIVTVTDKIKMQIAKGGGDISCFGDDLSREQLNALTGNEALTRQIEQKLKEADLPVTEENIMECVQAYEKGAALSPLTEGGLKYMLDNGLEPNIENIYKASYSGSANYVSSPIAVDISGIQAQIENIIKQAGLTVSEQTITDSKWLLQNDIALTSENIGYLTDLKAYTGMLSEETLTDAIVNALAEGKNAQEALLLQGYDMRSRAEDALSVVENAADGDIQYLIDRGFELTVKNLKMAEEQSKEEGQFSKQQDAENAVYESKELRFLTAKRQLEEIRLAMTAEANYALLKRGISIDTKPLAELVDLLKEQEKQYYTNLLESQGVEASDKNVETFAKTSEKMQAIQSVPAYVLGMLRADVSGINGVYENGMALKAAMERANQSYEPLMTAPRSDLGDSYSKAFGNINEILADLNMEQNEANRRAVRMLAYNQLEITEAAIVEMKAADEEVQRTFKNLTPKVVIEMLRRGENPLEMDFSMLNKTAENIKQELNSDDTERFSEFLWKLERNKEISEEERNSYIGVYRLLHQVEQTDGAAIGAVLNQGAELTLKNLLTAVRSANKQKKMDFSVDDTFGEQEQNTGYQNSITEQILAGYQNNCIKDAKEALTPERLHTLQKQGMDWMEMTPEQLAEALKEIDAEDAGVTAEFAREQLEGFKQCANTSEEVYRLLEQYDIPNSVQNILAMEKLVSDRNQIFKKLFEVHGHVGEAEDFVSDKNNSMLDEIAKIKEQLLEAFGEAVAEPKEMAAVQEDLGKLAENVMRTMIESDEVTTLDIKEAKLLRAQIAVQKKMSQKETFSVPVLVGDEVTNVTLKIVRGVEKRGIVDIMLETQLAGKIAATFQAKEDGISGMIAVDKETTKEEMQLQMEKLVEALQQEDLKEVDIKTAYVSNLDLNLFSKAGAANEKAPENTDAYQIQTARLYKIAESFIRTIKGIYK